MTGLNPTREELRTWADLPHGDAWKLIDERKLWDPSKQPGAQFYRIMVAGELFAPPRDHADGYATAELSMWATSKAKVRAELIKMEVEDFDWDIPSGFDQDDILSVTIEHIDQPGVDSAIDTRRRYS